MNKFPVRKCVIASVIISLVAFMLIALLYTLVNNIGQNDFLWIWLLCWGVLYGGGLVVYWIYQIHIYLKNKRKCEAKKKKQN